MEIVAIDHKVIGLSLMVTVVVGFFVWMFIDMRRFHREWPTPHKDPEKRAVCVECEFVCAPTRKEATRVTAICGHPTRNFPERDPITGVYKLTRPSVYQFNYRGQCRLFKRGRWTDLTPTEHEPLTRLEWQ